MPSFSNVLFGEIFPKREMEVTIQLPIFRNLLMEFAQKI